MESKAPGATQSTAHWKSRPRTEFSDSRHFFCSVHAPFFAGGIAPIECYESSNWKNIKRFCTKKQNRFSRRLWDSLQSWQFLQNGGRAAAKAAKASRLNDQNITSFWGRGVKVLLIGTGCALFAARLEEFPTLKRAPASPTWAFVDLCTTRYIFFQIIRALEPVGISSVAQVCPRSVVFFVLQNLQFAPIPGAHRAFRLACTALSMSALLDVQKDNSAFHDTITQGKEYLLENLSNLRRATPMALYNVWSHAYGIQALVRLYKFSTDKKEKEKIKAKSVTTRANKAMKRLNIIAMTLDTIAPPQTINNAPKITIPAITIIWLPRI